MARLFAIGALVVSIRALSGCGAEVEAPAGNSASSGDDSGATTTAGAGGSGAAPSGSTSGSGGGAVAPTCPSRDGDPFAGGMASIAYSHSSDLVFNMLASTDPNIWDLTYRNGELHAVVLSAYADEVARVEADGTVNGLFVTDVDVAIPLAATGDHFVLVGEEESVVYANLAGVTEETYPGPHGWNGATSEAIGLRVYTPLPSGPDGEMLVRFVDVDTHEIGDAFSPLGSDGLPIGPATFIAVAGNTLLLAHPASGPQTCFFLRSYQLDGTLLQELCVPYYFAEVNGMAFDHGCLAVADRSGNRMHYFAVTETP